jgi:hypothetical protein
MHEGPDRYLQHRRVLDLAWRLLMLQARPRTVARWTGLRQRSLRTLVGKYAPIDERNRLKRPRGGSPRKVELLLNSLRQRHEAAMLAHTCIEMQVIAAHPVGHVELQLPDVVKGQLLCTAFASFKRRFPGSGLTIEHGMLLVEELTRNTVLALIACPDCGSPMLIDRLAVARRCASCALDRRIARSASAAMRSEGI